MHNLIQSAANAESDGNVAVNRPAVQTENQRECGASNLFVDVTGQENKLAAGTLQSRKIIRYNGHFIKFLFFVNSVRQLFVCFSYRSMERQNWYDNLIC